MRRRLAACLLVALVAAPAAAKRLALPDGTRVVVRRGAGLELRQGERVLFALAPGAAPEVRRFTETVATFAGQWTFTRANETRVALSRVTSARRRRGAVVLKLASRRTRGQRPVRAVLTLAPMEEASTRLELEVRSDGGDAPSAVALPVRCDPDGTFHGFGGQYDRTDQRGEAFSLFVSEQGIGRDPAQPQLPLNGTAHTTYFPMPWWLDARGTGVLVETDHRVEVDLCKTDPGIAWVEVVSGERLRLRVFHGPTPLDVIRELGHVVGRPQRLPDWAFGLWMSAQGGRVAVEAKVAAMIAADLPVTAVWSQDWTGPRTNFDGGLGVQYRWTADGTHYPDLAGFVAGLHAQGLRFLAYVNPFVMKHLGHYGPMAAQGLLLRTPAGAPYDFLTPAGIGAHPDLSNPAAREYVSSFLREMVELGIDGWMSDFGEWTPLDAVRADGADGVAAHNRFPIEWHRLSREVLGMARPDGDFAFFSRSGWTGVQGASMLHWIGDQETSFDPHDGLPTTVPALVNLGLSAQPFVTHDIAGFSGTVAPPSTKELFLRWTELGAFTPVMRTHDGADREHNWRWDSDAETIAHFRRFARIHRALAPELQALALAAAGTSAPILRHLMLVFPDDVASRAVHDQFLVGDELLVAPVLVEGATTRTLYLPPDTWFDVWTGTAYAGPQTITVDAPIGRPPVFSRGADRSDLRTIE